MKTFLEYLKESAEVVHHTAVVPQVGFSPNSHMGHAIDLGGALKKLPGTSKHVGMSGKADLYSPEERKDIFQRQVGPGVVAHTVTGMGQTLAAAHDSLPKDGKKVLHILVGADRKSFGEGIKKSVLAGKVKELEGKHFDEVHVHTPEDEDRSHGMSGTKMRQAAADGNIEEFHRHLGSMFSREEAITNMKRIADGIKTGKVALKR